MMSSPDEGEGGPWEMRMRRERLEWACERGGEACTLLIFALAVVASKSISGEELVVPLALLCFLLLDALRPAVKPLVWATMA